MAGNCDLCKKEFIDKRSYQRHIRKCHGDGVINYIQSIKCSNCDETFSAENIYIKHYQSKHGGIPPEYMDKEKFFCEKCPEIFLEQYKLNSHKKNVHGVKNEFQRASHLFFPNLAYFPHIRNSLKLNYRKKVFDMALNFLPWEFLFVKKLDFEKTKTNYLVYNF